MAKVTRPPAKAELSGLVKTNNQETNILWAWHPSHVTPFFWVSKFCSLRWFYWPTCLLSAKRWNASWGYSDALIFCICKNFVLSWYQSTVIFADSKSVRKLIGFGFLNRNLHYVTHSFCYIIEHVTLQMLHLVTKTHVDRNFCPWLWCYLNVFVEFCFNSNIVWCLSLT